MRTCVKCGKRIKEKDAIYFDSPVSHPTRYICPCCAEEEGIQDEKSESHSETAEQARAIINRIFGEHRYFSAIDWHEEDRHDGKVTIVLSLTEVK